MDNIFSRFIELREENESNGPSIVSKIKLQKGNRQFAPFTVNKNSHSNLRYIIQAFIDSPKIGVGYTTIDKSKGEIEPQLKRKSLYLTGGAVRDHLVGKTPRNYDLVTDATPSEIEMILSKSDQGFTKVKPQIDFPPNKAREYQRLPDPVNKNKIFYPCRWDANGKELEICIEINGEKFYLATFSKTPKSRNITPSEAVAATSIEEDAANRDFTVNALYIPLNNTDGENADLLDPVGGAHDLKKGALVPIHDDLDNRMTEDPTTGFRYAKFNSRLNKNANLPKKHIDIIAKHANPYNFDSKIVKDEYINGLEHPDSNPRNFLKNLSYSKLLNMVFPGLEFNTEDIPANFMGDRWLSTAWILRNNDPLFIKQILVSSGWSQQEASDIAYLVKIYQNSHKYSDLQGMTSGCMRPGITRGKIREWMKLIGRDDISMEYY
jgi:tRNA nucleotidyltransferase/poly(A) polymerase